MSDGEECRRSAHLHAHPRFVCVAPGFDMSRRTLLYSTSGRHSAQREILSIDPFSRFDGQIHHLSLADIFTLQSFQ